MKVKYTKPSFEIESFDIEDVITASSVEVTDPGTGGEQQTNDTSFDGDDILLGADAFEDLLNDSNDIMATAVDSQS